MDYKDWSSKLEEEVIGSGFKVHGEWLTVQGSWLLLVNDSQFMVNG